MNIYVNSQCTRPFKKGAGLGKQANMKKPMVEESGHTACCLDVSGSVKSCNKVC